jgi:transposase
VAGEPILRFVLHIEQRLRRTMPRSQHPLTRDRVRIHSQIESLLEDGRMKLSGGVSDLWGGSSRRMLPALAPGESAPAKLADLADSALRATPEQLQDALSEAAPLSMLHREILGLFLARIELIESQIEILDRRTAAALAAYHGRCAEAGGGSRLRHRLGSTDPCGGGAVGSLVSVTATVASWVGVCPGREESARSFQEQP